VTREQTVEQLREIQRLVRELRVETESPTLERTMQLLDMYCHIARWELGDVEAMSAEAS
jgi:hypothetical protein